MLNWLDEIIEFLSVFDILLILVEDINVWLLLNICKGVELYI